MNPPSLFDPPAPLSGRSKLDEVRTVMLGDRKPCGNWFTLAELVEALGRCGVRVSESSAGVLVRDLRRDRGGRHQVDQRERRKGLAEYRVWRTVP